MTGWKLENVSKPAREAAKAAARKEKITLGEWLSRRILEDAKDQKKTSKPPARANTD